MPFPWSAATSRGSRPSCLQSEKSASWVSRPGWKTVVSFLGLLRICFFTDFFSEDLLFLLPFSEKLLCRQFFWEIVFSPVLRVSNKEVEVPAGFPPSPKRSTCCHFHIGHLSNCCCGILFYFCLGFIFQTLPKAQRTRGLSSYNKFKQKSWSSCIFRISTKHQIQNLNQTSVSP